MDLLGQAEKSLDICFNAFTAKALINTVSEVAQKNEEIKVRVLIEQEFGQKESAPTWRLGCHENVQLCFSSTSKAGPLSHNFALVDQEILIHSSLVWTDQALQHSQGSCLISKECV